MKTQQQRFELLDNLVCDFMGMTVVNSFSYPSHPCYFLFLFLFSFSYFSFLGGEEDFIQQWHLSGIDPELKTLISIGI